MAISPAWWRTRRGWKWAGSISGPGNRDSRGRLSQPAHTIRIDRLLPLASATRGAADRKPIWSSRAQHFHLRHVQGAGQRPHEAGAPAALAQPTDGIHAQAVQ